MHFQGSFSQLEPILKSCYLYYRLSLVDLVVWSEISFLLAEACGTIAVYQGPQKEPDDYSNFVIEDSVTTFKTIQQIKSVIEKLDEPHEKYRKKRSSSAKYGSK